VDLETDVLVVGGGVGGVAAALAAARNGRRTVLASRTGWLGGQFTTQGVSHLDEHPLIERAGASASYHQLRERIRAWYLNRFPSLRAGVEAPLNPGNAWVSRLSFEPRVGAQVVEELLAPLEGSGMLRIEKFVEPVAVRIEGYRVRWVDFRGPRDQLLRVHAEYVLEATETGTLLPLLGLPYRVGAEGRDETGEPDAPPEPHPEWVQSITVPFALEYVPGGRCVIPKPPEYENNRRRQPYSLTVRSEVSSDPLRYMVFGVAKGTPGSFWTYRRILDAATFADPRVPYDVSIINWPANDARVGHLFLSNNPMDRRQAVEKARRISLGFVYWIQTECPRDDGGYGYPEFRLRPDVMGTTDGLAQEPYVRESRRILGEVFIREQDLGSPGRPGAEARRFSDSVGIGWYAIDIHAADGEPSRYLPTRPFQIPLGALIPQRLDNVLASGKCLSASRLAAAAYRVHHVEWATGEAAGETAAACLEWGVRPRDLRASESLLRRLQRRLLAHGVPLVWLDDISYKDPEFCRSQLAALAGRWTAPPEPPHAAETPADPAAGSGA